MVQSEPSVSDALYASSQSVQAISLKAPTAEAEIVMTSQSQRNQEAHAGLSWSEGLGKYKLSKVITIAPRYVIKNSLSESISYREHGLAPKGRFSISPGERAFLHTVRSGENKLLTVAFSGLDTEWCGQQKVY